MTAIHKDIAMEQGAVFDWFFRLKHQDASPIDLTTWGFRMQVRSRQQQPVQIGVDTGSEEGGVILGVDPDDFDATSTLPVPSNGWVWVRFGADKTALINTKTGVYDNELYDPTDPAVVYRIFEGSTAGDPNITQETGEPVLS